MQDVCTDDGSGTCILRGRTGRRFGTQAHNHSFDGDAAAPSCIHLRVSICVFRLILQQVKDQ